MPGARQRYTPPKLKRKTVYYVTAKPELLELTVLRETPKHYYFGGGVANHHFTQRRKEQVFTDRRAALKDFCERLASTIRYAKDTINEMQAALPEWERALETARKELEDNP
jgi:hypothetical protein